jgi:hypothetical protein
VCERERERKKERKKERKIECVLEREKRPAMEMAVEGM